VELEGYPGWVRLLVVQTAFLGDAVLTTPLLRELRRSDPRGRLAVVARPEAIEALRGLSWVDEWIPYDKRGADRGVRAFLGLARSLRAGRFDVGIAAQRSARTALLLLLAGIRRRVGFEQAPGRWAYTDRARWLEGEHAVRRYLELARSVGGEPERADPRPELVVLESARRAASELLASCGVSEGEPLLVVAPGSHWATKQWTPDGFAEVVRQASARGLRPVLVGTGREEALSREILDRGGGTGVSLAGRTSIPELVALMARAAAVVANDSGPAHIASAVGTPVVVVFGPTVPAFGFVPWGEATRVVERTGLSCRPCSRHGPRVCPLGHHRCMKEIPASQVLDALDALRASGATRSKGLSRPGR